MKRDSIYKQFLTLSLVVLWGIVLYDTCVMDNMRPKAGMGLKEEVGKERTNEASEPSDTSGKERTNEVCKAKDIVIKSSKKLVRGPKEPLVIYPVKPRSLDTNTVIELLYYFDPLLGSDIDFSFRDTVVYWLNKFMRELELRYEFRSSLMNDWNAPSIYNLYKVPIFIKVKDEAPSYDTQNNYITIPKDLYKDPIILAHELVHYITDSRTHVSKSSSGWEFAGCFIKEDWCLNLMRSTRNSDRPFTFLLTKGQRDFINKRERYTRHMECDVLDNSYNSLPNDLVSGLSIEAIVECCDTFDVSEEDINDYFFKQYGESVDSIETVMYQNYFNSMFSNLIKKDICPADISLLDSTQFVVLKEINNQINNSHTEAEGNSSKKKRDTLILYIDTLMNKTKLDFFKMNDSLLMRELIQFSNFKYNHSKSTKILRKAESEYLSKLFGTTSTQMQNIRTNTSFYINRSNVTKNSKK